MNQFEDEEDVEDVEDGEDEEDEEDACWSNQQRSYLSAKSSTE